MKGVSFQSFSGNRWIIIPLLVPLPVKEKIVGKKLKSGTLKWRAVANYMLHRLSQNTQFSPNDA